MIVILIDQLEPWFKYIWEQFVKINDLNTDYVFLSYSKYLSSNFKKFNVALIEYSNKQQYSDSLFVPQNHFFETDDYIWLQDRLPIYRGTVTEGTGDYDIFYNAFIYLSRLEEWESEKKGRYIHSYSSFHPRKNKRIWKIPVVNLLFNELEKKIKLKYPQVSFGYGSEPMIEYSHDVDYINKTIQLRIKQTLFHLFNSGNYLIKLNLIKSIRKLVQGINFAYQAGNYWCFDYWNEMEKKLNIKSVFYFFAKIKDKKIKGINRWVIDPSYDIAQNIKLKTKCAEMISNGNKIAIHGSYFSAIYEGLFQKEKDMLEDVLNSSITKSRQHWLNYHEKSTPYIHSKAGIEEDSTIGFNDISGFRAGVASRFNPYDHKNQAPFVFEEIPIVVMDSHIHYYSDNPNLNNYEWLLDCVAEVKNFSISINWHQRVSSADYGWANSYPVLAERFHDQVIRHRSQERML